MHILQRLGEGMEDYGVDIVRTSEMCMHHGDVVSHTKAEKSLLLFQ